MENQSSCSLKACQHVKSYQEDDNLKGSLANNPVNILFYDCESPGIHTVSVLCSTNERRFHVWYQDYPEHRQTSLSDKVPPRIVTIFVTIQEQENHSCSVKVYLHAIL